MPIAHIRNLLHGLEAYDQNGEQQPLISIKVARWDPGQRVTAHALTSVSHTDRTQTKRGDGNTRWLNQGPAVKIIHVVVKLFSTRWLTHREPTRRP